MKFLTAVAVVLLLVFVWAMLLTIPCWLLWNWQMPQYGLPRLDMDQMFWIIVLVQLVVGTPVARTTKQD